MGFTKLTKNIFDVQIIWGNRFFKYKNECLYSKNMVDSNCNFFKDVLDTHGKIKVDI